MIFNYGPNSSGSSSGINFNGGGGGFNPLRHLKIKFDEASDYILFNNQTMSSSDIELIEDQKGYLIFLKTNCYLNFTKTINNVSICTVGGGGAGAVKADNNNSGSEANKYGGGGGAGGQIKTIYLSKLQMGKYISQIGLGGSNAGENGNNTFFKDNNNNIILQGNGGYGGDYTNGIGGNTQRAKDNGKIENIMEDSSAGGNSNFSTSAWAYRSDPVFYEELNGEDGNSPLRAFYDHYFLNNKDNIYLGAGGGGGSSYYDRWVNDAGGYSCQSYGKKNGQKGQLQDITDKNIQHYGDGGNGGSYRTETESTERSFSPGENGIIIIRIPK